MTWSESDLLGHIYAGTAQPGQRVAIAPGDDMAMVRMAGTDVLAAVDQIVDGVHVRLESTPIELVGRKAVARCLSDVAAMAARPVAALAAVTLPRDFPGGDARRLFDAMLRTAREYGCPVVGGDIAGHVDPSAPLVCSVTVIAEPAGRPPIQRRGARVGDVIYVTGMLGHAYAPDGGGRHLTFAPRIPEALELADRLGTQLHAMIDLSDGLGRDAAHLARASGVGIIINADTLPAAPRAEWMAAMSDGEDYELCFAAAGPVPDQLSGGLRVTAVGRVVASPIGGDHSVSNVMVQVNGQIIAGDELGWEHRT